MKKTVLFIALFLVGFSFMSCEDNDDNVSGYVEMTDANDNANDASADASLAGWEIPRRNATNDYITR